MDIFKSDQFRPAIGLRQGLIGISSGIALAALILVNLFYNHTFHPFETLGIFFLLSIVPACAVVFWILCKQPSWLVDQTRMNVESSRMYLMVMGTPLLAMIFCYMLNSLNQWLDFSLAQSQTYLINNKHYYHGTKSGDHYVVTIDNPDVPAKLFFNHSRTDEDIDIDPRDYQHVAPGQGGITLNIHPGLFGFPWFENDWSFDGLSQTIVQTPAKIKPMPPAAVIAKACSWAQNFNADIEIEKIAPDDYRRDYWPGGQPRSVEPLVQGKIHGIGHYTFANGQLYGDIPWKHGQKHGTFTLYREEGSIEQKLSYKNGYPFGLSYWYRPDGSLQESWLVIGEGKFFPASLCEDHSIDEKKESDWP